MDSEISPNTLVKKLNKTTERIKKARKNKIPEKEAAEFKEIHRLLEQEDTDDLDLSTIELDISKFKDIFTQSCIPVASPSLKVFHEELIFFYFKENNCQLKNFISDEDKHLIFGENKPIPTEECFRKLITYHVTENLIPEGGSCSSVCLYVLYLMSVHPGYEFVTACFDFLKFQKFHLQPEDIFPVFINFGAKQEDLFEFNEEIFKKFSKGDNNNGEVSQKTEFPFFNMEKVGQILLQYITENLLVINSNIKSLIKGLVKITLDSKINSGSLLPLYSTLLTFLCASIQKDFTFEEILSWVYLKEQHLLNQLEICRNISRPIFSNLYEGLVLKTLSDILETSTLPTSPPIKINHIKSVLKKLKSRDLPPLELYCLLQLINGSLPGVTATAKDSTEIKALLTFLEQKIRKIKDSADLIRLKLEIAKVGTLVTNNMNNNFTVRDTYKSKLLKALIMVEFFKDVTFFILPLGFGCKRIEFFENKIQNFGGTLGKNEGTVTHVAVEDSVAEDREKCCSALKKYGFEGKKNVKYVKVKWLSKCLGCRALVDTKPFEIEWIKREVEEAEPEKETAGQETMKEDEDNNEDDFVVPGKKQKIENEKFICSKASSSSGSGTSQKRKIIEELEKLANAYNIQNDTWRSHSYRKAINAIMLYDKDICTYQEAVSIPGVGEKMALKIMEIIESGKLQKVEEIVNEKTKVLDSFCKIWGVGPSTAEGWYVQGFRTLEDLKTKGKLNKQQQIGLRLYDDLLRRISREEVLKIAEIVEEEVGKINGCLSVELVGSFRRGKLTCGDVDCMIVNSGIKTPLEILLQVTESLRAKGYISDDLVTLEDLNSSDEANHHRKYFGIFKLPGENQIHRRIDLFVVPKSEYASALMHYTGSALFNRSIKLLAAKKNMTLTEHGLYRGTVRKGSEVTCKGQLVSTLTEEDIFKELGLPYRHPEERDH